MDLYQRRTWIDRQGMSHEIASMPKDYVQNVINMLERNAETLAFQDTFQMIRFATGPLGPSGDMACDAFDQEMECDHSLKDKSAVEWLRSTPLMQALRAQMGVDGS